ncbi:DNA gyrase C-terminal beta-propeller domain-containing protein, partial [Enterococcus faecium]|uniref:DNA gyrase C-terminal beta-propeller domain-containing protein n=1 Tax=Enterococcus faecium TaxID=1352 RepID=UPI00292D32FA
FGTSFSNHINGYFILSSPFLLIIHIVHSIQNLDQFFFVEWFYGYSVTFKEEAVRDMGRTASGVRGIRLREEDYVVGAALMKEDQ